MNGLAPCPVCGHPATVTHMLDTYDRADYGWDAGCARARIGDGIHPDPFRVRVRAMPSKRTAIDAWNRKALEIKEDITHETDRSEV